jgi:hypothetical protein
MIRPRARGKFVALSMAAGSHPTREVFWGALQDGNVEALGSAEARLPVRVEAQHGDRG